MIPFLKLLSCGWCWLCLLGIEDVGIRASKVREADTIPDLRDSL
jgi:hypothetical protein